MNDLISRKALLAEYDRVHIGEPGKARKLIEDAPTVMDDVQKFLIKTSPVISTEVVRSIMDSPVIISQSEETIIPIMPSRWIPVSERLPESGVHVLLCCEIRSGGTVYKRYVCDGYYAKKYTEQTWNNSGDIDCEYREEDDEYYLLEGWYEVIKNWDDYNSIAIHDFVTHWMPLPEPPKEGE